MVPENWKIRMEMLRHLARGAAMGEGPPSVREVGEAVGLKSSQTAYKHLKQLEEAGYLEREGGNRRARGIRLTKKGWEAAGERAARSGTKSTRSRPSCSALAQAGSDAC